MIALHTYSLINVYEKPRIFVSFFLFSCKNKCTQFIRNTRTVNSNYFQLVSRLLALFLLQDVYFVFGLKGLYTHAHKQLQENVE